MHNHSWVNFNDQLSYIPTSDEQQIRVFVEDFDEYHGPEFRLSKKEFVSFVAQIYEKMGW